MDDRTLAWARNAFENDVQMFLDEPYGIGVDIEEYMARLRVIAHDLRVDLGILIARVGRHFEIERLQKLLAKECPSCRAPSALVHGWGRILTNGMVIDTETCLVCGWKILCNSPRENKELFD